MTPFLVGHLAAEASALSAAEASGPAWKGPAHAQCPACGYEHDTDWIRAMTITPDPRFEEMRRS